MITAIVFVQVKSDQIPEVAEQIAAIEGVSEVYSVTGRIDLIVMVRVRDFETVAHIKPPASRSDSAELYVIAKGFRGEVLPEEAAEPGDPREVHAWMPALKKARIDED